MIHNREMALPDFQRDFVWEPNATNELIQSIMSNYPAGSLLRIKNGHQLLFQPRAIEGSPLLARDARPSYLILDGQQRLTSLYQSFYGVGEHLYYVRDCLIKSSLASDFPSRRGKPRLYRRMEWSDTPLQNSTHLFNSSTISIQLPLRALVYLDSELIPAPRAPLERKASAFNRRHHNGSKRSVSSYPFERARLPESGQSKNQPTPRRDYFAALSHVQFCAAVLTNYSAAGFTRQLPGSGRSQ